MEIQNIELQNPKNGPIETLDLTSNKKHTAMLERLSNKHQSRLQNSAARRSAESSSSPSFESVQSFLKQFSDQKQSIEADLHRCRSIFNSDPNTISQIKSDLQKVHRSISDLEKFVSDHSYFLPPYEIRSSLKTIEDLKEMAEIANSEIAPRKKFHFKNKGLSKKGGEIERVNMFSDAVKSDVRVLDSPGFRNKRGGILVERFRVSDSDGDFSIVDAKSDVRVLDSPGFRNKRGEILVKLFRVSDSDGDFSIVDLESCDVYLKGRFRALFMHRIRDCRVFAGPVLGSILIEEVKGCLFMLASHQIRIHCARECDFYLRVRSRPIIEDCSGVRFAPYRLLYEGIEKDLSDSGLEEETGNWANVDDFLWLRAVQSPNWSLVPEEEFVDFRDISELEEKSDEKELA